MVKVSVVIPVYNCEAYIERCIKSLLKQSLKEVEIVLVDDGSKDNSLKICQSYAEKYSNVKVKHIENSGAATARIEGIRMATGQYIGFVDSDDWVQENMYQTLYTEAERLEVDIIQCGYEIVDSEEKKIDSEFDPRETRVYEASDALRQLLGVEEKKEFNFLLWNKIYKADIFKNLELPTYIKTNNDVPVIPRTFCQAKKVAAIDTKFVYYFMRNNSENKSISDHLKTSKEKLVWSHIKAFNDISLYFKNIDREIYMASLKYTVSWALTAYVRKGMSKECKRDAIRVIKESKVWGNKYIPIKKKIVALLVQAFC